MAATEKIESIVIGNTTLHGNDKNLMVILIEQDGALPGNDPAILGQGHRETLDLVTRPGLARTMRAGPVTISRLDYKVILIVSR